MRAIIIAAGQGRRLRPHTDKMPKCMVPVAGRPIIEHQLEALEMHGIDDIVVIRGHKGGAIRAPGARFVVNADYQRNNILESLMKAARYLQGEVIISYGDIVYRPSVVGALVGCSASAAVIVDRRWESVYDGRHDHPHEQAELVRLSDTGGIAALGKKVTPERTLGEFIGLMKVTQSAIARLWASYFKAKARGGGIGFADSFESAYLTDLLNEAIKDDLYIAPVPIDGGWREIDTVQDLERANAAVAEWATLASEKTVELER